jgi:predicted ribosome quality control (RQC) complex YloA/Tae2 family protein
MEFFSSGNIILVGPDGKIIIPLISQIWSHRSIKSREEYIPPPAQTNPFKLSKDEFFKLIKTGSQDTVRALAINLNLSGIIAEELCTRANIDKKLKINEIDNEIISKLFVTLSSFLQKFKEKKFTPVIVKKDNKIVDILPVKLDIYKNFQFKEVKNFSTALENLIGKNNLELKRDSKADELTGKLNRKLKQQMMTSENLKEQINQKKIEGDLIYLNIQEIEKILLEIKEILDLKDKCEMIEKINEKKIIKIFDPTENLLILNLKDPTGNNHEIKINYRKSVTENAEIAYYHNKKLRNKLKGAETSILKTRQQLQTAEKEKSREEKREEKKTERREKQHWFERFRWFISSEGNLIIAGKDEKTNDLVVKKHLKEGDRYAHADIQGAPSVIIKSTNLFDEKIEISEKTLREACIFAASYSKAWKQFADAQAYWVLPEQVSKTPQSGEFIPRGGFVIRGKRTYYRSKLEIAIGEIRISDEKKIMAGPIDAVKKRASRYVVLVPGSKKRIEISRKIAKELDTDIGNIEKILPSGGINIIEAVGIEL